MARKGNPISVRLDLNRSSDPSRFSDYYYGKSVYQDFNQRSYFGSIRPPTILTFGFRLGRCIILHFPKRTFIHFFLPRRPLRLKQPAKSRPGRGRWWAFDKVGPIRCLYSSEGTEEQRNEVRGLRARKRVELIRLDDRDKQNSIRPKRMLSYGYHDRSPSIKTPISKLLRVSGAHPKYAGVVNNIAFLMENVDSSRSTQLLKFFLPKKYRGQTSNIPVCAIPRPSFHYFVMQYLLNTKNKMHFDPVSVLNHFVAPAEPSTLRGRKAGSLERRIRSRIAFLVSSFTSDRKCLAQVQRGFLHLIRLANDLRFAGTTKTTISLFPFFGATFFFPRDGVGVYKNLFLDYAREQLLGQLRIKCWNLMGQAPNARISLMDKLIDLCDIRELIKGIEMMIEIILRKRRIPYGYNSYLNEVHKMRYNLFNRTKTNTLIESVKIKSVYQSASLIAQDISFQPRNNPISFRSIFSNIVKEIPLIMPKGVEGIRVCCSGRLGGAEIARTECGKFGKTSPNVFNHKIDYAPAEVSTRYGISGVKVRISYSIKKKGRATSETYEIL
uniref:Small ribosomal subunit protein uS3m n=1 Tax=Musa coccinea TaxID=574483 RepID=A0A8D5QH96_9LILI|nr:ribosomal protein S3 [Musa coccinea]